MVEGIMGGGGDRNNDEPIHPGDTSGEETFVPRAGVEEPKGFPIHSQWRPDIGDLQSRGGIAGDEMLKEFEAELLEAGVQKNRISDGEARAAVDEMQKAVSDWEAGNGNLTTIVNVSRKFFRE